MEVRWPIEVKLKVYWVGLTGVFGVLALTLRPTVCLCNVRYRRMFWTWSGVS